MRFGATEHASSVGAKPCKHFLVPNEQVTEDKTLKGFLSFVKTPLQ